MTDLTGDQSYSFGRLLFLICTANSSSSAASLRCARASRLNNFCFETVSTWRTASSPLSNSLLSKTSGAGNGFMG